MKKFTKFFVLLFIGTAVALSSCKTEDEILDEITVNLPATSVTEEVTDSLITVSGTIQGVIRNASNSDILAGVTVGYASNGTTGSVTASATGGFSIAGLVPGEYILTFAKEGFSTVTAYTSIPSTVTDDQTVPNGGIIEYVKSVEPAMYPLTAGAKGYLFINDFPAEGVTVQLDYTTPGAFQFAPALYTAVVDEDGYFEFQNVPGTMAFLKVPACTFMGYYVDAYQNQYRLGADVTTSLGIVDLETYYGNTPEVDIVWFSGRESDYNPKEGLEFTFNQTIDLTKSEFGLYDYYNSVEIPITVTSSKALNTITITPESELWVDGYEYEFWFDVVTVNGVYGYGYYDFYTMEGIQFVSSNLQTYPGDMGAYSNIPVDKSITINYSLDVDPVLTEKEDGIRIWDAYTGMEIEFDAVFNGSTITITPDVLEYDNWYNCQISAYSGYYDGSDDYAYYSFQFGTEDEDQPLLGVAPAIEMIEGVEINDNTVGLPLTVTAVAGAERYRFYAKDSYNNQEWVLVEEMMVSDIPDYYEGTSTFTHTLVLPSKFDYFEDDSYQTPFSHGTQVSIKLVSDNFVNISPESNVIVLKDETPLTPSDLNFYGQYDEDLNFVSANNPSAEDVTFAAIIGSDLPFFVDETVPPVSVGIYDAGVAATDATVAFEWHLLNGFYYGYVNVTVDAGASAVGYEVRLNGISDASGNVQTEVFTFTLN